MKNEAKKTLKNILYGTSIAIASLLPMKKADGQMKRINHPTKRELNGQMRIEKPNAIHFGIQLGAQPLQGYTLGYSRKITQLGQYQLGSYLLLSKGKYNSPFNFFEDKSNSHVDYTNISLGIMIHTEKDYTGSSTFVTFGPSYNILDKKDYAPGTINEKAFRKLSFEGGAGAILEGKFGIGFLFNPFLGEGKIDCTIPFGHH